MLWFLILAAGQIAGTHLRCSVFNAVYSPESNYHLVVKSYFSHFREWSSFFFLVVINLALGNGKKKLIIANFKPLLNVMGCNCYRGHPNARHEARL